MNIEKVIIKNLTRNDDYARKVLPFLKSEYFLTEDDKALFESTRDFLLKYNTLPTNDSILLDIESKKGLREETVKSIRDDLALFIQDTEVQNLDWLMKSTEEFCQEKSIYLAIMKSIDILGGGSKTETKGAIPKLLSDALGVSFDPHVGHDYLEQFSDRYDYYHRVQEKIAFDLDYMNRITRGGVPRKTLNIALAGTGVGKSLFMCHVASHCLTQGLSVLYITLELAEEEVAKRIDANLLDITFDDLMVLPQERYDRMAQRLKGNTTGKLIIKEYPTAGASVTHFKALLNELYLKKSFKPDVIFVDYLNICRSARLSPGSNVNSYTYVKAIAEELRGLAVEFNVPLFSATQTTRAGFTSSDPGLEDTSESFGLPATADLMFALVSTEELEALGQIMVKQLKNRYNDPSKYKRFVVGIDRAKMRLYDVEDSAQTLTKQNNHSTIATVAPTIGNKFSSLKV
jgi:archaellum biogenesis ATPase FlaH